MARAKPRSTVNRTSLAKAPTGIQGLDELTGGGLPKGRVSLVCGKAGCGKSLLGMEFLVHGAVEFGEPGVCMNFEETEDKLIANVASHTRRKSRRSLHRPSSGPSPCPGFNGKHRQKNRNYSSSQYSQPA
jgi:predicted ATP-dependent serine protease